MDVALRTVGRLLMIFPLLFTSVQILFDPSSHLSLFQQAYQFTYEWLMARGLKMLMPLEQIKGGELFSLILLTLMAFLFCCMFMLGDNRTNFIWLAVVGYFSFYSETYYLISFWIGVTVFLVQKPFAPPADPVDP